MSDALLNELTQREYQHGFVTDVETEIDPAGAQRGRRPPHLEEEERARVAPRVAAAGLPPLAHDEEPTWATRRRTRPSTTRTIVYYSAPKSAKERPEEPRRRRPRAPATYEKLGIPLNERDSLAGVAVDAVFDSVSVATTFKDKLASMGIVFCSFSEAVHEHPELVRKYLGSVVPITRQLLRDAELGGLHGRLVLLHPEGRALPDGALDVLPHQRRPTRASSSGR